MLRKILIGLVAVIVLAVLAVFFWPETKYQPYEPSAAYQAQVAAFNMPTMPPDWTWNRFEASDGTGLRWGETGNRGTTDVTIVIVPGYTASVDMMAEHVRTLAAKGYHIVGVDMRGQGGSDRDRAGQPEKLWIEDFAVYSDDLAAFIGSELQDRTVIPMAVSFGGHVAARMAKDHPGVVDGLFLVVPAFEPKGGGEFEKVGGQLNMMQTFGFGRRYLPGQGNWTPATEDDLLTHGIDHCSSNPKRLPYRDVLFTRNPEQRVGGVTVQWGAEFFQSAKMMKSPGYYDRVTIPVGIVAADQDDFVDNDAIDASCDALVDCHLRRIPGTGHCLPQETDEAVAILFEELDGLVARLRD